MESKFAPGFYSQNKEFQYKKLEQEGTFPDWISGSLLRTGPAIYELEHQNYKHWYDGLAMLYKFSIHDGNVEFNCKHLKSKSYKKAKDSGKVSIKEWATDPCRGIFEQLKSYFVAPELTDNGNINIIEHGDEYVATSETPLPILFDKDTLETLEHMGYEDDLQGQIDPAHMHKDTEGNIYSYLLKYHLVSKYQIYKLKKGSKKREKIATIPVWKPSYMHSFGYTENYMILVEFPYNVLPMEMKFADKPLIKNYKWEPEHGTRYQVINLKTGEVNKYKGDAVFAFHHVNAFEKDGKLYVDMVLFDNVNVIDDLYLDELRRNSPTHAAGKLHRATIDLEKSRKVTLDKLSDKLIELPRTNYPNVNGKDYQYMYGAGNTKEGNWLDDITKIDVKTGMHKTWYEKHSYPSEPVFIPKPDAKKEDDGILLSVVLNADKKSTYLVALDAFDLKEIARATVPEVLPFSFHGIFTNNH